MAVHVRADRPANTPFEGVEFTEAGQVVVVEDDHAARELLKIEGFSEVVPPPVAADPADGDEAKAAADKAAADKAAADKAEAEANDKAAKGARGKAVTE